MSLSNQKAESTFKYGKILLGTSSEGPTVVPLAELEGGSERLTWTQANTEEYKRRVRDKAAAMAKSILLEAQREAKDLKAQAKAEGHREGRELARRELELVREEMAGNMAGCMTAFQSGRGTLWNTQRQDIVALIKLAVEKAIHLEMSTRSLEILEHLLDQAVDALDSRQRLIVKVHPGDEDNMLDLLRRARERHPDLGSWRVKANPALQSGGIILESDHGLVDNSVETRLSWIREVLDHLTFSEAAAPEALASLEAAGILPEKASDDLPLPSVDPVEAALDAASGEIQIQAQAEAAQQAEEEASVVAESDATEKEEAAPETAAETTPEAEHDEEETAPDPNAPPVHLTDQNAVDNFFESHAAAPEATPESADTAAEEETPEAQETPEAPEAQPPLQGQGAVDDLFENAAAAPEEAPEEAQETAQEAAKTPLDGQSAVDDLFETAASSAPEVPESEAAPVHLESQDAVDDLFENAAAAPEEAKTPLDGQNAVDDLFEAQAAKAADDTPKEKASDETEEDNEDDKGSLLGPDFTQVPL
jgi:flagellar assembly protein FliH